MSKKFISIIAVFAVILSFASCGNSSEQSISKEALDAVASFDIPEPLNRDLIPKVETSYETNPNREIVDYTVYSTYAPERDSYGNFDPCFGVTLSEETVLQIDKSDELSETLSKNTVVRIVDEVEGYYTVQWYTTTARISKKDIKPLYPYVKEIKLPNTTAGYTLGTSIEIPETDISIIKE